MISNGGAGSSPAQSAGHYSDDPLSPDDASLIVGVPAVQLLRWACDRVGPKNIGTRYRPRYREADLITWLSDRAHVVAAGDNWMRDW